MGRTLIQRLIIGAMGLLTVAIVIFFITYDKPAYPIEFTANQNVLREPPTFHLADTVDVEAVFTNTTKQNVTFTAAIHWVLDTKTSVVPTTDVVQLGLLTELIPGCTKMTFINKPPQDVIDTTKKLFDAGEERVEWHLQGSNVVILPKNAGERDFMVDHFVYVADSDPLPLTKNVHDNSIECRDIK